MPPIRSGHGGGNTFVPFYLEPQSYKDKSLAEVVADLLKRLAEFTATRRDYYDQRRAVSTRSGLWLPRLSCRCRSDRLPFDRRRCSLSAQSGLYAVERPRAHPSSGDLRIDGGDRLLRSRNRQGERLLPLCHRDAFDRDLWTKLEFEVLKELEKVRKATDIQAAEAAARDQILALAEAYCMDLDKITTTEATEWRTEFQTSMGELEETARKGARTSSSESKTTPRPLRRPPPTQKPPWRRCDQAK